MREVTVNNLRRSWASTVPNLYITMATLPQAVRTESNNGTTGRFVRSLYDLPSQSCTHILYKINGLDCGFITIVHSPNNDNNKGNT